MKLKISIGLMLGCSLALMLSLKANASCCYTQPVICPTTPATKMHWYADAGLGQTLRTHLSSSGYGIMSIDNPQATGSLSLSPRNYALANNLLLETGLLWSQLYRADLPYFPFINLGIRYQYSNVNDNKTLMRLTATQSKNSNLNEQLLSDANYDFSQSSLLGVLKLDLYRWGRVMPYVNVGLGTAWHQAKQKELFFLDADGDNKNILELHTRNLKTRTFAYSVGAGFDFPITENFWLSLGYQYNDVGDINLKPIFVGLTEKAQENIEEKKLNDLLKPFHLNNLSTQTIQLTGRYVFG